MEFSNSDYIKRVTSPGETSTCHTMMKGTMHMSYNTPTPNGDWTSNTTCKIHFWGISGYENDGGFGYNGRCSWGHTTYLRPRESEYVSWAAPYSQQARLSADIVPGVDGTKNTRGIRYFADPVNSTWYMLAGCKSFTSCEARHARVGEQRRQRELPAVAI
eukprot:gene11645-13755_t